MHPLPHNSLHCIMLNAAVLVLETSPLNFNSHPTLEFASTDTQKCVTKINVNYSPKCTYNPQQQMDGPETRPQKTWLRTARITGPIPTAADNSAANLEEKPTLTQQTPRMVLVPQRITTHFAELLQRQAIGDPLLI